MGTIHASRGTGSAGAPPVEGALERRLSHIRRLLEPGVISAAYQPIVRLSDLLPIGYEGLARFPAAGGLGLPPDVVLDVAGEVGMREALEIACWDTLARAGSPPSGRLLFLNVDPATLADPGLLELADRLPSRLVIELTERRPVTDYGALRETLAPWVARGASLAIDDTGSGYASLEHVVQLRPHFLKLSRGLVAGIERDAKRQALLRALVAFAREVGSVVVAEGVETAEERAVLVESDVDYGQGWLFGRPAPAWPDATASSIPPPRPSMTDSGVRRMARLERELAAAGTTKAACEAVVEHLARMGLMPSIYLLQGGRLRCQAVRGYWQVFDGMPPTAGVIGRTFRTGEPTVVLDVEGSPDYLAAVPGVRAEICVPVRVGDRNVGALNVESPTPLREGMAQEVERCATLLGRRLPDFGVLDVASPAQRLARSAARLASLSDHEEIVRETATAARAVSGLESVMLALLDDAGELSVRIAEGPFSTVFRNLSPEELRTICSWVDPGTSAYTMGDAAGQGFVGHEPLRRAGAGALVVLPVVASGERAGLLALADRSNVVLPTEQVELLELLAMQAAAELRMASVTAELRRRAERDPLTGLGHHATFHTDLQRARAGARDGRQIAVVMADVDGFKSINDTRGHAAGDDVLRAMARLLRSVAPDDAEAYRVGGDEFALLAPVEGRAQARRIGRHLQLRAQGHLGTSVSIGVALALPGESDAEVLARADAALYEVKRAGRDGVAVAPSGMRQRPAA